MRRRPLLTLLLAATGAVTPRCALAQSAPATTPPREASQWDFLIGDWELDVRPKVSGLAAALHGAPRLAGHWRAWRAFDGFGIADELRIVDASGNPVALNHALRAWDPVQRRWAVVVLDVYRGRVTQASAQWQDGEMRQQGQGSAPDGKPLLTRTRLHDIGSDRFALRQDRSADGGASWDDAVLVMHARRSAPRPTPR